MNTAKLYTVGQRLADKVKIPRQTIASAIDRGQILATALGCGTTVVSLDDVATWSVSWRKKSPSKLTKQTPKKGIKRGKAKTNAKAKSR